MTGTALDQIVCWVVSDGRRGIENQALGLAEAVARRLADQSIQARIERVVVRQDGFVTLPSGACPDIWIGCGRAAVQIVSKHRRIFPETYFVYIQDPRRRHDLFDLIIAPDHDRLKRHNAIGMIGSPNRVAQSQLTEAAREFKDRIEALPGPRAAILIGGDSKRFKLDASVALYLEERLQSLLDQNVSLMITVSRRTPVAVRKTLHDRFAGQDRVWFHDGESDPDAANPYFAFLAAADWVFVTEESTNMLVEAATLGKPVYVLAMSGRPGKFARLHAALEGSGAARPYLGHLDTWRYDPLDETGRVADILIQRWQAERAAHENGDIMSREDLQVGRDSIVARHGRICFASQPGQADLECWAAQGVTLVINSRAPEETQALDFDLAEAVETAGMRYETLPMGGSAGIDPDHVERLDILLRNNPDGTVVMHCRSGTRSAHLYAAWLMSRDADLTQPFDTIGWPGGRDMNMVRAFLAPQKA